MGRRPLGLGCTCLTPWSFQTSVCCRQGCVGSSPGPVRSRSRLTYSRALDTEKAFGPSAATGHCTCTGISPVAYRWWNSALACCLQRWLAPRACDTARAIMPGVTQWGFSVEMATRQLRRKLLCYPSEHACFNVKWLIGLAYPTQLWSKPNLRCDLEYQSDPGGAAVLCGAV